MQQFVLYATAPGQEAREIGWPDEAVGAFSSVLIPALRGKGRAKAWSWEANCYEVRWERLANYVKRRMTEAEHARTDGSRCLKMPVVGVSSTETATRGLPRSRVVAPPSST